MAGVVVQPQLSLDRITGWQQEVAPDELCDVIVILLQPAKESFKPQSKPDQGGLPTQFVTARLSFILRAHMHQHKCIIQQHFAL